MGEITLKNSIFNNHSAFCNHANDEIA